MNLLAGNATASVDPGTELAFGRMSGFLGKLKDRAVFVWYDYFCIPQVDVGHEVRSLYGTLQEDQWEAIANIPFYISACTYFVALCPELQHHDTGSTLTRYSWTQRGWCLCEFLTADLVGIEVVLLIQSSKHLSLIFGRRDVLPPPMLLPKFACNIAIRKCFQRVFSSFFHTTPF